MMDMREEKVFWNNGKLTIEGLYRKSLGENGVVICHPHPLMGGSMHNNVVGAIQEVFSSQNYTTLRFNFRGAGNSTGNYDEGKGEQEDILSACEYLKKKGIKQISLAAYSFGAWVASKVIEEGKEKFAKVIMVSPPLNMFDFHWDNLVNKISMIVCGDHDQFCDVDILRKQAQKNNYQIQTINRTDHFYFGKERELIDILCKFIIKEYVT